MSLPTVSIGFPVYNGEKYLKKALDSLLGQDYKDFEIIISDNASTDKTPDICREYAKKDSRIRYYYNESNYGAMWNYRKVFMLARGKYFKWAAHDDECYPSMLRRCVETLDKNPTSVLGVYPLCEIINEYNQVVGSPPDHVDSQAKRPYRRLARVLFRVSFAHSFYGLFRTEFLHKMLGYRHIASDHLLLAEISMWGEIWEIPELLFRLRLHPENAMEINKTRSSMEAWFDPRRRNRWPMVPYQLVIMLEHLKSVRHTPLSPLNKIFCYITVLTVPPWRTFLRNAGRQRDRLRGMLNMS